MTPVITALPATVGIRQDADRLQCGNWVHVNASPTQPAGWHQVTWLRDTPTGRRFILATHITVDTKHGDQALVLPASAMTAYLAEGVLPWNQ